MSDLDILHQAWSLYQEWDEVYNNWRTKAFLALDSAEIEEMVQKFSKKVSKLAKDIKNWNVFNVIFLKLIFRRRATVLIKRRELFPFFKI